VVPEGEILEPQSSRHPLAVTLEKHGVSDHSVSKVISRLLLFRPVFKTVRGFDEDTATRLLRISDGKPDPKARWSGLSSAERLRAKRAWNALSRTRTELKRPKRPPTSMGTSRSGRPPVIDSALVLYCMRVLCEANAKTDFPLSRDVVKGQYGGPMWRALLAVLPQMQSYVALRSNLTAIDQRTIARHTEAIAGDVKFAKSKSFRDWCGKLGLGAAAEDVANNADTFRVVFAIARKVRRGKGPPT
jgi:hypothetical protein